MGLGPSPERCGRRESERGRGWSSPPGPAHHRDDLAEQVLGRAVCFSDLRAAVSQRPSEETRPLRRLTGCCFSLWSGSGLSPSNCKAVDLQPKKPRAGESG